MSLIFIRAYWVGALKYLRIGGTRVQTSKFNFLKANYFEDICILNIKI